MRKTYPVHHRLLLLLAGFCLLCGCSGTPRGAAAPEVLPQSLRAEYEDILAGLPLYDGLNDGVGFADYIDMDLDGTPELLVISKDYHDFVMDVYGEVDGHAKKLGDGVSLSGGRDFWVSLVRSKRGVFVQTTHGNPGIYNPTVQLYYGVENGEIYCANTLISIFKQESGAYWVDPAPGEITGYGEETVGNVSEKTYNAVAASYSTLCEIGWYSADYMLNWRLLFSSRGALPDFTEETLRRFELVRALWDQDVVYARLLDINGDGAEELVVLREERQWRYGGYRRYFRVYSWNGAELEAVDFDQSSDPAIMSYLSFAFDSYSIRRETSTGEIFFVYEGNLAGGWGGALFINADGYRFYEAPVISYAETEDLSDAETAALLAKLKEKTAAYRESLSRYALIEDCGRLGDDSTVRTVDAVIQELMAS